MFENRSISKIVNEDKMKTAIVGDLPSIAYYASDYLRYNGPVGLIGANRTTHTAEVKFLQGAGLAVVKAFPLKDKGWVNEALAWTLGKILDVGVPPHAMLLAASPDDLISAKEPELVLARNQWADAGPIIFWCASKLEIKQPQYVWSTGWERAVTAVPYGQKLAAFDSWLGNCDRIAVNAPYWVTKGKIAAIDHERLAFNRDWISGPVQHLDVMGLCVTHLLKELRAAIDKKKIKSSEGERLISRIVVFSRCHSDVLNRVREDFKNLIIDNFGEAAANNLLNFLTERAEQDSINVRLEQLL